MTNIEELRKEYDIIKKKYNLPSFDELDKEFEIRAIKLEECGFLIKAILRSMFSKMGYYLSFLESAVTPMPNSLHSMLEVQNLSQDEKQGIFNLYKRLQYIWHKYFISELKDEREVANSINQCFKEWTKLKKELIESLEKISGSWIREPKKVKSSITG